MQVEWAERRQATTASEEPAARQEKQRDLKTTGASVAPAAFSSPFCPMVLTLLHLAAYVVVGGAYDPRATAASAAGATVVSAETVEEHQNTDIPFPAHIPAMSPCPV